MAAGERRWWERAGFADRLARRAPDLDLVVIALDEKPASLPARANDNRTALDKWRQQLKGCLLAVALCAIITVVAMQWLMAFEAANGDALSTGRGDYRPAVWPLAIGAGDLYQRH